MSSFHVQKHGHCKLKQKANQPGILITKCTQSCLEKMRKYAPRMKEKAFLSIVNQNFPRRACPQTPNKKGTGKKNSKKKKKASFEILMDRTFILMLKLSMV